MGNRGWPTGALLRRRFEILFVAVVLLLVAYPHAERAVPGEVALPVLRIGVLLAVFHVLTRGRRVRWVGLGLFVAASAGIILAGSGAPSWARIAALGCELALYMLAVGVLSTTVFHRAGVGRDTLFGAACAYLLIALAFAAAFELAAMAVPGSFALSSTDPGKPIHYSLVYFSLVTLTTLGYGDVLPQSAVAHSLAALEAAVGIFFPAVLVARLVALYR